MAGLFPAERELAQLAALRLPARLGLISKRLCPSTRCGPNLGLAWGPSALRGKTGWSSAKTAGRGQPTMTKAVWAGRTTGDDERKFVLTLALNLAFSPGEKESLRASLIFRMVGRQIPAHEFSRSRRAFLLL